MMRSCFSVLLFFLFTYEEQVSSGVWIFSFRIYAQLALLLTLVFYIKQKGIKGFFNFIFSHKTIFAYMVLQIIPWVFSFLNDEISIDGLNFTVLSITNFSLAYFLLTDREIGGYWGIIGMLSKAAIVMSIVALIRVFYDLSLFGLSLPVTGVGRLSGWMRSANYFSMFVAIGFIFEFHKLFLSNRIPWSSIFKLFLFLIVIILSGSRGTLISIGIIALLSIQFIAITIVNKRLIRRLSLYLFIGGLFLLNSGRLINYLGYTEDVFENEILRTEFKISEDPRVELWTNALEIIINGDIVNTLFGHGVNRAMHILGRSSHNSYLSMTLDYGVVFLFAFIGIFTRALRIVFKRSREQPRYFLVASLLVFLMIRGFTNNVIGSLGVIQILFNMSIMAIGKEY